MEQKPQKRIFYTELCYIIGLILLAIGTAMMEKADFGMSMVVAPAYLLHLKLSQYFSFFTFGMAEYVLQFLLLILLSAGMRKFRFSYLISFATAVIYGLLLDLSIACFSVVTVGSIALRIFFYAAGMVICAGGIALLFHTYIVPEAYELIVKEFSAKYSQPISRIKTIYDCTSCVVSIILSFAFFGFGKFEGIKWGTILCALVNGKLIDICGNHLEKHFTFADGTKLRKYLS